VQVGDVVKAECEWFCESGFMTSVVVNKERLFAPLNLFPLTPDGDARSPEVMAASALTPHPFTYIDCAGGLQNSLVHMGKYRVRSSIFQIQCQVHYLSDNVVVR